jgi:hypothetical protein
VLPPADAPVLPSSIAAVIPHRLPRSSFQYCRAVEHGLHADKDRTGLVLAGVTYLLALRQVSCYRELVPGEIQGKSTLEPRRCTRLATGSSLL